MKTLGYTPFDCDNHYYEALDAFTRHVPREWQKRCVQWCDIEKWDDAKKVLLQQLELFFESVGPDPFLISYIYHDFY